MNNKYFNLLNPVLDLIDNGKFFYKPLKYFYYLFGFIYLVSPILVYFKFDKEGVFYGYGGYSYYGGEVFKPEALFVFLVLSIAFEAGALVLINRAKKVDEQFVKTSEYLAVPVLSHIIKTFGEFVGIFITFLLTLSGILAVFSDHIFNTYKEMGMRNIYPGVYGLILGIIVGYLIILITRMISEQLKALAEIAQNSKYLAKSSDEIHQENGNLTL